MAPKSSKSGNPPGNKRKSGRSAGSKRKSRAGAVLIPLALAVARHVANNRELQEKLMDITKKTSEKTVGKARARREINHLVKSFIKGDQGSREALVRKGSKAVRPMMDAWGSLDTDQKCDAAMIFAAIGDRQALVLLHKDANEESEAVRNAMKKAREEILRRA